MFENYIQSVKLFIKKRLFLNESSNVKLVFDSHNQTYRKFPNSVKWNPVPARFISIKTTIYHNFNYQKLALLTRYTHAHTQNDPNLNSQNRFAFRYYYYCLIKYKTIQHYE